MAITLGEAAQNAACNGVVDLIDAGAGAGLLKIKDAGAVVLVAITLGDPAFSDAVVGVATAEGLPRAGVGAADGTPASYDVTDSDGNVVWSGTIPSNMTLDAATIAVGQTVSVVSWTHTQPAS